jgi:hypothetical protein
MSSYAIGFLRNINNKSREDFDKKRQENPSRDTMYRFYSKDTDKINKRLNTPGYIGVESFQTYYTKYKNMDKELET